VAARTIAFDVCELPAGARTAGNWLQSGGDATHTGATTRAIEPPVHQLWATSIAGGNVVLGTPVVRDGTIVIGVWDLGAGDRGGVVALDLATGQPKWRYATKSAVRASPAIGGDEHGGDIVVVPLEDGTLHGVSLASGKKVWEHAAGRGLDRMVSSMWSSPAIAGDAVYVSVPGRTTALRLRDGTVIWSSDRLPQEAWLGSLASIAVADDLAITAVSRDANIAAHQATTGTVRWRRTDDIALRGVHAAPVIAGDRVFVAGAAGVVTAISLITSLPMWQQPVVTDTNDWSYTITATPAYARGKLIVPTQRSELLALDAASGEVRWRHASPRGPITFSHYRSTEPGFPASPVITGDIVWVPHLDGTLAALDLDDGAVKWRTNLGAPIASAPAPAGDYLIVATFDGVVRAFVHAPAATPAPVARCGAESPAEAGCNRGRAAVIGALAALGALLLLRRRYATS
jgi:outer membrane protein assembly factor BamB